VFERLRSVICRVWEQAGRLAATSTEAVEVLHSGVPVSQAGKGNVYMIVCRHATGPEQAKRVSVSHPPHPRMPVSPENHAC